MVTRAEQKQNTRRTIIDASLRLSAERGLSALSLRSVAAEAGIAPATFYRHFADMDDLSLALVDEVGVSLRRLVREARDRVSKAGSRNVIANAITTFMEVAENNANLFRLLRGEGAGGTIEFRRAIQKEIDRFAEDLIDDLRREAKATNRPIADIELAAQAMVTVTFNLGAAAIDLPPDEREEIRQRIIVEVRMIMRGAQAMAGAEGPIA